MAVFVNGWKRVNVHNLRVVKVCLAELLVYKSSVYYWAISSDGKRCPLYPIIINVSFSKNFIM